VPAVVQHRTTFSNGTTTLALAFLSNNAAANLLVYCTSGGPTASAMNVATDSNTNTIANAVSISSSGSAGAARLDYVANAHSGANTVTGHSPSSVDIHLHIWEISGCVTSSPVRATGSTQSPTGSVSTSTTTPLTGDAVLAFFYDNPANDTLTVGSGYTTSDTSQNGTGGDAALSEYKSATAGGTQTAACGGNGTDTLAQVIAVFIQSSATFAPDEDYWKFPQHAPNDPDITVWQ
jgi:hypothetical protein